MEKLEKLCAGKIFKIVQYSNGDDYLFFESENRLYFKRLMKRHLAPVGDVTNIGFSPDKIELVIQFHDETRIPEKYRERLYQPLSNLFNSYAKAINSRYNRRGSLFTTRFQRQEILT